MIVQIQVRVRVLWGIGRPERLLDLHVNHRVTGVSRGELPGRHSCVGWSTSLPHLLPLVHPDLLLLSSSLQLDILEVSPPVALPVGGGTQVSHLAPAHLGEGLAGCSRVVFAAVLHVALPFIKLQASRFGGARQRVVQLLLHPVQLGVQCPNLRIELQYLFLGSFGFSHRFRSLHILQLVHLCILGLD